MNLRASSREPKGGALLNRLSVNEFMWPETSFEADIEVCLRAAVPGIGLWEAKLGMGRDQELVDLLRESGLQATVCAPAVPTLLPSTFFDGPSDPAERIDGLLASIRRFEPFGPAGLLTITGADSSLSASRQREVVVDGYRRLGSAAAEIGAWVGIEPLRNGEGNSLIKTVAESADLVAEIDTEGVGIAYDIWHHWDSPTLLEDIDAYASLFTVVQIEDWPRDSETGFPRAIPGDGVIQLDRVLDALQRAGYSGWYDLELLSDPLSPSVTMDPDEMLDRTKKGLEAVWLKAGLGHAHLS